MAAIHDPLSAEYSAVGAIAENGDSAYRDLICNKFSLADLTKLLENWHAGYFGTVRESRRLRDFCILRMQINRERIKTDSETKGDLDT